ncbi:MAG: DUF2075 domain-containing protein [Gammaproteobacteria bacterium]|nr:DUF2075 domain-containing protein [Gammaproteobacteria bacterium]
MTDSLRRGPQSAWYEGTREDFLSATTQDVANQLAGRAAAESLAIESAQTQEWQRSISLLQTHLGERIPLIRDVLAGVGSESIRHVILEFDFRRRGLRLDCVLLADGVIFVVEFKRTRLARADFDQVMTYAVNLLEFHKVTREWCAESGGIVVPVLALTTGELGKRPEWFGLAGHSWPSLAHRPLECDRDSIKDAFQLALKNRRTDSPLSSRKWIESSFRPSSSILDAALSLYGNHDVAAIEEHAAPKEAIEASVREIRKQIEAAITCGEYHILFLSGAPGAGKTLVGLDIVMRGEFADQSVFVTGNAPLVDVLNKALAASYRAQGRQPPIWAMTGYKHTDAHLVASAATFKIVKAHKFLSERGRIHHQEDSRILVFDEAQRTYEKGRVVLNKPLPDHEADLILAAQRGMFPHGGAVVVALVGHNQAINRGERGIKAWLEAADRGGWSFSIDDETLSLAEITERDKWSAHPKRKHLFHGHLRQSMRFYRNSAVEEWVGALIDGRIADAASLATQLGKHESVIWLTRNLSSARRWGKRHAIGGQRVGLIASGQARRLAAEGLFVDHKPDIADWMLTPGSDIRSSNTLETVQNQYQIQGLELDYSIVCWDADFRHNGTEWTAHKLKGEDWQNDSLINVAKNGYRVLLTRARKGMVIFVPKGDLSGEDKTRNVDFYDGVWEFLKKCGALEFED